MNASKNSLVAVLTTSFILLTASASHADNKNNQGNQNRRSNNHNVSFNFNTSSFGFNQGTGFISDPGKKKHGTIFETNFGHVNTLRTNQFFNVSHNQYWFVDRSHRIVFTDQFVEPVFVRYVVLPGDTFATISLRLFRTANHASFLASLNHVTSRTQLVPGQVIVVPGF
jgi:hypothetical protein